MAGRHSKRGTRARIFRQWKPCRPGIEVVDARTRVAHRVDPDDLLAGRQHGDYQALCGAQFLVASMVDPGQGQCQPCREQAVL